MLNQKKHKLTPYDVLTPRRSQTLLSECKIRPSPIQFSPTLSHSWERRSPSKYIPRTTAHEPLLSLSLKKTKSHKLTRNKMLWTARRSQTSDRCFLANQPSISPTAGPRVQSHPLFQAHRAARTNSFIMAYFAPAAKHFPGPLFPSPSSLSFSHPSPSLSFQGPTRLFS